MSSEFNPKVLELLGQSNIETQKIKPIQPGLVKEPEEQDHNFWSTLGDMALSAPQGIVNAVEEQGDFLDENIVSVGGLEFGDKDGKLTFKDFIPKYVSPSKWKSEEYSKKRQLPTFHKPETLAGNMTEGISRFVTGFAGPAKFLKGVGLGGTVAKSALRGLTAGAVADLTVFDPNEGRLSDMLVEFDSPVLNNAVTQYLATDENDTEMAGRLKNVLEGMVLGTLAESIFYGIRGFKKMKKTKDLDQRAKIQEETAKVINDAQKGKKTKRLKKFALDDNPAIDTNQALKVIKTTKESAKKDSELWIKKVLNTKSFKNGDEVLHTIDDVAENMFDDVTKEFLESDVLSNQTAEELATLMSANKEDILKTTIKEGERVKDGTVRMLAAKQLLQELAFDLQSVSKKYLDEFGEDAIKWSKESKEEIALRKKVIAETFVSLKNQIRGAARTTQAGRIKVTRSGGKIIEIEKLANIFKNYDSNPAVMAKQIADMKPEDIINEVSKSKLTKYIEVFNSLYINSILSGTPTFIVNTLGNAYEAFLKPLETISGAALKADIKTIRTGWSQYVGMIHTMRDTVRAVGLALKQGDAILDPLVRTQDNLQIVNGKSVRPISGANLGFNGKAGTAVDWIGRVVEMPTRLLMATDELFKQLNYRGRLYAQAIDNTLELQIPLGTKQAKENIDKIFREGFDKNGMANVKDNDMAAKALEEARIATFTNTLDDGRYFNVGQMIEKSLREAPYFRFLVPFVRTPTNLWRNFEQRIPVLGAFTKPMKDLWKTGDRRARAEVLGRQLFGVSATMYAWYLTRQDVTDSKGNVYRKITGAGPKDFNIKKTWLQNGWQPYSIAQENPDGTITYKQYNRMDPRFYIFGIMADVMENEDNINDEKKQDMFTVAVLSAMRSAGNKSYLRGISDAFDLSENFTPENISKYFGRQIGNAIPYQALIGQGIPGITEADDQLFEARGFVDEIIRKAPFIEKTKYLEPRRDLLTGEPIERTPSAVFVNPVFEDGGLSYLALAKGPIMVGRKIDIKEDPVLLEIMRLKIPLSEPNEIQEKSVNLIDYKMNNQSAHNYWVERIGKTLIGGLTLKEKLDQTIDSIAYKRRQEGNLKIDGGKEITIKKVFEAYKKKARQDMLDKYPKVKDAIIQAKRTNYGYRKPTMEIEDKPKELLPRL
tara:strand:+ start:2100 stop:5597 length:3498 start_codon:yes stop_codon:yes gene_type:complete